MGNISSAWFKSQTPLEIIVGVAAFARAWWIFIAGALHRPLAWIGDNDSLGYMAGVSFLLCGLVLLAGIRLNNTPMRIIGLSLVGLQTIFVMLMTFFFATVTATPISYLGNLVVVVVCTGLITAILKEERT
jgi:hypothetical protein